MFHGPREEVVPFFESMHFYVPERKAVSDFLQEVTSKKDQKVNPQPKLADAAAAAGILTELLYHLLNFLKQTTTLSLLQPSSLTKL